MCARVVIGSVIPSLQYKIIRWCMNPEYSIFDDVQGVLHLEDS